MAKRQAYEKGGNKLHIYNDHIFTAVHFTGRYNAVVFVVEIITVIVVVVVFAV